MRQGERIFGGLFGLLLTGLGLYVLMFGVVEPLWRYPGGLVLAALGVNAIYGALTARRSWISRIGPLP